MISNILCKRKTILKEINFLVCYLNKSNFPDSKAEETDFEQSANNF